jgi:hypothetical protein
MQFRHAMGAIPILLTIGAISAMASTVSYTLDFTAYSSGLTPSSGSFVYNTTTDEFTSFVVDWDGAVYNMTTEANAPASAGLAPGDPCITASGAAATFQAFTTCDSAGGGLEWNALGNSGVEGLFEFFYKNAGGFGVPIFSLDTGDYVDPTAAVGLVSSTLSSGPPPPTVPEPSTMGVSALGCAFLFVLRSRRSTRKPIA